MNPELQALRVYPLSELLEPRIIPALNSGREARGYRIEPAGPINLVFL
jgi:hypothetical protein